MARITELNLRDIRCFEGEHKAELSRITLLVGENSTGKSTFLGCYSAFATLVNMVDLGKGKEDHFDRIPFRMGKFDTIVRSGESEFSISGRFDNHIHTSARFCFIRGEEDGGLFEREVDFEFNDAAGTAKHINISFLRDSNSLRFKGPGFVFDLDRANISYIPISTWLSRNVRQGFLPYDGDRVTFKKRKDSGSQEEISEFAKFINFFRSEMPLADQPSLLVEAVDPEFPPRKRKYVSTPSHLDNDETNVSVGEIGRELGLLKEITVKELPEDRGTEVLVKIDGGSYNLVDVGYGVHSLLPLLKAINQSAPAKIFLLQQPEIHVHPVAQAQLAQYMAEGGHDFIIETHSDHLIDRFRICVMQGVLLPEELSIIYFEPNEDRGRSQIHSIRVDKQGNLVGMPDSYRLFFLRETEKLLGF